MIHIPLNSYDLGQTSVVEEKLKQEERTISISIEKDEVGSKIKDLEKDIRTLQTQKDNRSRKLDDYNKIAQNIKFSTNTSETIIIINMIM